MEAKAIALLFSQVTAAANDMEVTFLVSGIPREYDDLEGWTAFDGLLRAINQDADVRVHADAYLYGEGETVKATPEEVAYMMMRQERNPNFLSDRCAHIETVDFDIQCSPGELFGQSFTT